jgi:hypothetical protein
MWFDRNYPRNWKRKNELGEWLGVELLTPAASARKLFSVVVLPAVADPGRQVFSPACGVLSINN